MRIPLGLKVAGLAVAATAFYTYVGQLVPQSEVWPPEDIELSADLTPEEMVEAGREIAEDKGGCLLCHTIGQAGILRYPDLAGIGARAGERVPGMSALDYLAESLYDPEAYVVPGFAGGMPPAHLPPVGLTDEEILAVIAWLQSLGGEVTVTMETRLAWADGAPSPVRAEAVPPPPAEAPPAPAVMDERALLERFDCGSCHHIDGPGELEGPSLFDVGDRMGETDILATLLRETGAHQDANFQRRATIEELRKMVVFLSARRGNP
jgi:mono/diheme cytochrome c family protein